MKLVRTALKHLENQPVDICGAAVLNTTPSSDWFVSHRCHSKKEPANYFRWAHVFGTGMFHILFLLNFEYIHLKMYHR